VVGHLTPLDGVFGIAEHLVEVVLDRVAAIKKRAIFAVLGIEPVVGIKSGGTGDGARFFAERAHGKGDGALTLKRDHAIVDLTVKQHRAVAVEERLVRDCMFRGMENPLWVETG